MSKLAPDSDEEHAQYRNLNVRYFQLKSMYPDSNGVVIPPPLINGGLILT